MKVFRYPKRPKRVYGVTPRRKQGAPGRLFLIRFGRLRCLSAGYVPLQGGRQALGARILFWRLFLGHEMRLKADCMGFVHASNPGLPSLKPRR
jgi:hypothetical protein